MSVSLLFAPKAFGFPFAPAGRGPDAWGADIPPETVVFRGGSAGTVSMSSSTRHDFSN
jgi:hypothetical protein